MSDQNSDQKKLAAGDRTPISEWLVAVLGFVLVAVSVVFLLYQTLAFDEPPPEITFLTQQTTETKTGFLTLVSVRNEGGRTVAGLTITGDLKRGDLVLETSETTLDYVPAHSTRQVGLFFTETPAAYNLVLRAGGYQDP